MGCHCLLQGIFPTQGTKLGFLYCTQSLYSLSHRGNLLICAPTEIKEDHLTGKWEHCSLPHSTGSLWHLTLQVNLLIFFFLPLLPSHPEIPFSLALALSPNLSDCSISNFPRDLFAYACLEQRWGRLMFSCKYSNSYMAHGAGGLTPTHLTLTGSSALPSVMPGIPSVTISPTIS